MNYIQEKEALCFFQSLNGFNKYLIKRLFKEFDSYYSAATATKKALSKILSEKEVYILLSARQRIDISLPFENLLKQNINFIIPSDHIFPDKLKLIPDPPLGLYIKGNMPISTKPSIAIIGARNCSPYGSHMAKLFAREIALADVQIISGLARGIDSISQNEALSVGGYTCAVLGCGVDICYPAENKELYNALSTQGGLISEYPPGTKPLAYLFPPRNRIISGIADAIIVIEARIKSGTSITVNMALEQGRDIYALPGRVCDNLSLGCNLLIKDGATPLISPKDFIEEFMKNYYSVNPAHKADANSSSNSNFNSNSNSNANSNDNDNSNSNDNDNANSNSNSSNSISSSISSTSNASTTLEALILPTLDFHPKTISEIYHSLKDHTTLPSLMQELTSMTLKGKIKCVCGSNYYIE